MFKSESLNLRVTPENTRSCTVFSGLFSIQAACVQFEALQEFAV